MGLAIILAWQGCSLGCCIVDGKSPLSPSVCTQSRRTLLVNPRGRRMPFLPKARAPSNFHVNLWGWSDKEGNSVSRHSRGSKTPVSEASSPKNKTVNRFWGAETANFAVQILGTWKGWVLLTRIKCAEPTGAFVAATAGERKVGICSGFCAWQQPTPIPPNGPLSSLYLMVLGNIGNLKGSWRVLAQRPCQSFAEGLRALTRHI